MTHVEKRETMTMAEAKALVKAHGFRVAEGACWEDETHIYAFSVECLGRGTFGHPAFTAHFNKVTGYLDHEKGTK